MHRFVAIALLVPLLAAASDETERTVRLDVKPVLCITDRNKPRCDLSFIVVWQSTASGYYCLHNDFEDAPLTCWRDSRNGRTTDDRSVANSFSFWMTGQDPETRLAEVDVEVLQMDSGDRRRRRRTRHVWDIN